MKNYHQDYPKAPQGYPPSEKKQSVPKKPFIEPGTPCDSFQQILSTTQVSENGLTTYLTAKALRGPLLAHASQECSKKQAAKRPLKKVPETGEAFCGALHPHLEGYSTITHQGLYRTTNQDEITIYMEEDAKWFGVYDGHGGNKCSQFLKDKLHELFFRGQWEKDVPSALRRAFVAAETEWRRKGDNSGSCGLVVLIHHNQCYVANLGDSRAILLTGEKCFQITKDHKPSNPDEQRRIIEAGGKIYQTTAVTQTAQGHYDVLVGPLRVFPGRLSTTRTFGDCEAKDTKGIIIFEPQIASFDIDQHDLLIMGSDGLWDKFDNVEVGEVVAALQEEGYKGEELLKKAAEGLLKEAMSRGSADNISLVVVGLNDGERVKEPKKGNENIKILSAFNGVQRRKGGNDKENYGSHVEKIKEIDSKIIEINRNASRILQQSRRS